MKLYERLKQLRTEHNLTLRKLAEQTELSVSYLSDIERGRTSPSLGTLESLAKAFDMSVLDFLIDVDFAGESADDELPQGLKELIEDKEWGGNITSDWISMLKKIQMRGKRPDNKQDWLELYLHLRRILE